MAAITASVVGVAIAAGSAVSSRKQQKKQASASKKAARGQEASAIESAQFLQQQGIEGERLIRESAIEAAATAGKIPAQAVQPLLRIAELGGDAFSSAARDILGGQPSSQAALSDIIGQTALAGSLATPTGAGITDPVQAELARQAGLTGEIAGRQFSGGLFDLGRQGVLAEGDIAQIGSRGSARLGDIATQQASGRSAVLVGAAAPAASAIQGAGDARLLGEFAANRLKTQNREQLAGLAGQAFGSF